MVVLVYPYFNPPKKKSDFRFPPLGLGYIASYLRNNGIDVELVDCTFLSGEDEAIQLIIECKPTIIGFYSMFTLKEIALRLGEKLHEECDLLVVGGPMPSADADAFLEVFDIVVMGEGEETMLELTQRKKELRSIDGIVFKEREGFLHRGSDNEFQLIRTKPRAYIHDLDSLPLPARDLYDNKRYIEYYRDRKIHPTTSIMSSRGCHFNCDFCSRPVFGNVFRERSPFNILEEVIQILSLGYKRIFFQDDCFTLTKKRVIDFCNHVKSRGIDFEWECLSRVDSLDRETATLMREAGCRRIFFGLESGSDVILEIMNKDANKEQAKRAVGYAKEAKIKVGAFFIIGYPGETNETMLQTVNFASSLPLDYLSFSFPYPIPGTGLYEKVRDDLIQNDYSSNRQKLVYRGDFSERKLRFAQFKGLSQFYIRKLLGPVSPVLLEPYRFLTDLVINNMN